MAGAAAESDTEPIEASLPKLPQDVRIMAFARHRAQELASLTACIEESEGSGGGGNKRVFQHLPHYMRRRAMSHNVKRVPRRLREIYKREIEKVGKKVSKKPSRKHRRRPSNLLLAYNRRQRNFVWLETHIWHAKRFKMDARWGYKIPLHPCDKSMRACYRAATNAVLLQDISYLCCIDLWGQRHELLEGLAQLTNSNCGLTFASVMHSDGTCEGTTFLYHISQYPYGAIGPVTFHWWAMEDKERKSGSSRLWLWSHPSIFRTVLDELIAAFHLKPVEVTAQDDRFATLAKERKDLEKLAVKLGPFHERPPIYQNNTITLTSLKDQLVRFRLLGQLSTAVLTSTLQTTNAVLDSGDLNQDQINSAEQVMFWTELAKYPSTLRIAPRSIIAITVHDPRESLPIQRNRVIPQISDSDASCEPLQVNPRISHSCLWNREIRDKVTFSKMSDAEMNHLRSQNLVPGTPLNLGNSGSHIPVLLIHQCANDGSSGTKVVAGSGWDMVLPAGWGMAFWIPLVYHGARVGGFRENGSLTHERGGLHFPEDFPDTLAGKEVEQQNYRELKAKYFRYPPSKRPNFIKLGIAAPFSFPWNRLVTEQAQSVQMANSADDAADLFYVLRDRRLLRDLQRLPCFNNPLKRRRRTTLDLTHRAEIHWNRFTVHHKALVTIQLSSVGHSALTKYSVVCAPVATDLVALSRDPHYAGPCEPHHEDTLRDLRRRIATEHKALKNGSPLDQAVVEALNQDGADDFERFFTARAEQLRTSCSRTILGWIKSGGFTFAEGRVTGLAFVVLGGLIDLLKVTNQPLFLVREPHSFQYHFAEFTVQMALM